MNIVFFGTSEFAVPSLEALVRSRHKILALVTQPDRKSGRNLALSAPPAKTFAAANGIPVYQPENASARESAEFLKRLSADLFVVISFGQILKMNILSVPRIYAINLHGSLLPKYRGAAPTNWAIVNGDKRTGVSVIKMNERMDEGEIILKKALDIEDLDTNITLSRKLSEMGSSIILNAIDLIEKGKAKLEPQDDSDATYAPKLTKEDGLIVWSGPASQIEKRVRGLLPWPGAYTYYNEMILKILKAEICGIPAKGAFKPGEVVEVVKGKGIVVSTGSGGLAIKEVQLEGKKAMDADAFVRGHAVPKGYVFG